jgi:sugar/nucleoside kinase (ribokinase family)
VGSRVKILVAGELNVDLVLQNYRSFPALGREVLVEDAALTLGSSSAICASGLAKLGNDVVFAGKLGCDSWGDLCIEWLNALGIECSPVLRESSLKTGITVSITSRTDRALVTFPGSMVELRAGDIRDNDLKRCRHLHVSSFYLQTGLRAGLKSLFERAHAHGLTTSLDPGFDPEEKWGGDLVEMLPEVDVFLPNETELAAITHRADRAAALRTLDNGRTITVAKLGEEGCMAVCRGEVLRMPAYPVTPLDTTGAGDSFDAGFLHAWLRKEGLNSAMSLGSACGALSTLQSGGTTGQPLEQQAREFVEAMSKGVAR